MSRFRFDRSRHALTGPDGEVRRLRPQSLEVFLLLLEHADRVVRKDDIVASVWKGVIVTDDSVAQCIADIRRALGKEHRDLLQTVPKVGYRLRLGADGCGEPYIRPLDDPDTLDGAPSLPTDASRSAPRFVPARRGAALLFGAVALLALVGLGAWRLLGTGASESVPSPGPTMAVLPFRNASPSAENDYFSDGVTEDLITALSRFSQLGVVSWSAVSGRSGDGESIREVAGEFGVRYLVSGSVRHDAERVRVAVRLTDARDGRLLWSERYDESLQDTFVVQDRISRQIAAMLSAKLARIETELARRVPTSSMAAYQLSLLGRHKLRDRTRAQNLAARALFAEAIALDPSYADAHVLMGETYLEEAVFGWTEWPERSNARALELARKAVELGGHDTRSLNLLAKVHVRTGRYGMAQRHLDRAFELNPDDPRLHGTQGLLHIWNGAPEAAVDHLEYVLRYDPLSTFDLSNLGIAHYVAGRPKEAIAVIERAIETAPNAPFVRVILTAAYAETGDIDAARRSAAVVRRQHPFFTADGVSRTELFAEAAAKRRIRDSLRRAGLE